jgi:DNA-binding CsgD family transcriptional regulator
VLCNVDWLHREGSDVEANSDELVDLPARTREVLCYLVKGDPPKQISYKLGLSVHTVQDHIKAIYRRFNVNSRGELLAKFIAGPADEGASTP